jgi:hypothetical protein
VRLQRVRESNSIPQVRWPTLGLGATTCFHNDLLLGLNKVIGSVNLGFLVVARGCRIATKVSNLKSARLDGGHVNTSAARSGST